MKQSSVHDIYNELSNRGVTLVAVSKTKPVSKIRELYDQGIKDFGENRVQELVEKHPQLPDDIRWHMIGNLQKNKVKYIASFVHLIHSVSSINLLKTIHKEAIKNDRTIDVLIQIKIAEEESKSGMERSDAKDILQSISDGIFSGITLKGFMGMATFTDNMEQIRREFRSLKEFSDTAVNQYPNAFSLEDTPTPTPTLSMGMSGDYKIAIEEGANMVRIGSLLFGPRNS